LKHNYFNIINNGHNETRKNRDYPLFIAMHYLLNCTNADKLNRNRK
jgi:hypothetical protein